MPSGQDTFQQGQTATTGPFNGAYLWSNTANWVDGVVPVSGDSVSNSAGGFNFDDIAALDLGSLTQGANADTDVVATSLTVGTVTSSGDLVADAFEAGAPVRVQIGTIAGTGGVYTADDTGAVVVDLSAVDPGNNLYAVISGGFVTLAAAPASSSTLSYIDGPGTFALENPAATTASAVNGVVDGDVLELPGSSVSAVSFGTNSLTVTTNVSSYTFSNVTYDQTINSYVAASDSSSGLEAITFGTTDTFQQGQTATTGPFNGAYLWSNTANWVDGVVPVSGDSVSNSAGGFNFDDIAALDLGSLTQGANADTDVVATSLTVGTVTSSGDLVADAFEAGAPVRVQIGTIAGTGDVYTADDTGAVVVDLSAVDPGNNLYAVISGGFVTLAAAPASSSTLSYIDGPGTFALENPAATTAAAVNGVVDGDVLELPGSSVSAVSFGTDSLTVTTNVSSYTFSNVTYDQTINSYVAAPDASTGLEAITFGTVCFCEGSLIRTPSGDVPVETLEVGASVVTWRGEHRPITWIGVGKVLATRGRRNAATPVIVRKNALGDNVPHADLRVTKGHSLFIDGALIPVELLVNHRSILWDDRAQEVSIYHVELATHDVLIANGAPAESYRDDGNRWLFRNADSAWGMKMQEPCATLLTGGAVVDGIWARLLARSGTRPGLLLVDDPDLHLRVDGHRVDPVPISDTGYVFRGLSGGPFRDVRIVSRAAAPDELGLARDPRVLGVAVRSIAVLAGARHRTIEARDDRLCDGFHCYEPELDIRWTDGDAGLPAELFAGFTGPVELLLQANGVTRYLATEAAGSRAA